MPRRDGTGPQGAGSKTGAQMGACEGAKNIPFDQGRGNRGCGGHKGQGNRRRAYQQVNLSDQNIADAKETQS